METSYVLIFLIEKTLPKTKTKNTSPHSLEYICIFHLSLFYQVSSKPESGSIGEEEDACSKGESDGGEVGLLQRCVVRSNQQATVVVHHLFLLGQARHRADVFDGFCGCFAGFFQSFFVLTLIMKKLKRGTV